MTENEKDQILKEARKISDGMPAEVPPANEIRRQGNLSVKMVDEIARRWEDLGLDYNEARGLYNADVMQAIYTQRLENVGILKRWTHRFSCEMWKRNNSDVIR
jgi:hypothetical protein